MSFFVADAYAVAEGAVTTGAEGAWGSILLLVGFVLIFYFLLWRPQSKRAKAHRELVSNLNSGDEIVTTGGMVGKITKVTDDFIQLNIAQSVEITLQKVAVAKTLPNGTIDSMK